MRHEDHLGYPPRLMRLDQAARYIDVSPSTFLRLLAAGLVPKPIRMGGIVAWDRFELDAAVEDQKAARESADTLTNFFSGK